MKFNPAELTELTSNLWNAGAYEFKVLDATEVTGMYGEQIALTLQVLNGEKTKNVKVWLSPTTKDNKPDLRLMFFCKSVGLEEKYQSGELLDSDCMYKSGYLYLGQGKSKNGDDINVVQRYLSKEDFELERNKHNDIGLGAQFDNDEALPF